MADVSVQNAPVWYDVQTIDGLTYVIYQVFDNSF